MIVRQEPIDEAKLDPKEWVDQSYSRYSDEELKYLEEASRWHYENTDHALIGLLDDFHEAGVDILNPVQISAKGMDPKFLKNNFGDKFVFWGGGIDAQHTLPFGSPAEVEREVAENVRVFGKNGGFVFNNVHNIQAGIPIENLTALFESFKRNRAYKMK